jgi:hypothetical protein
MRMGLVSSASRWGAAARFRECSGEPLGLINDKEFLD